MSLTVSPDQRKKARVRPSGEKAGSVSPQDPRGGEVSLCLSPFSEEIKKSPRGSAGDVASAMMTDLPSGDQVKSRLRQGGKMTSSPSPLWAKRRSGPPNAGMEITSLLPLKPGEYRMKAM